MEALIKKAKELGIENAETLTEPQLKKAISKAETALKTAETQKTEHEDLLKRAVELGFDKELFAEFSIENLKTAISEAEAENEAKELAAGKAALISELLGVDFNTSTLEEVRTAAETVVIENAKTRSEVLKKHIGFDLFEIEPEALDAALIQLKATEASPVVEKVPEGKTSKYFKSGNGIKYVFDDEAPEAFRFADVVKTQKEWMEDADSMELMIQGGVSYVKPLKK
jgi:hypothetical protein